MFWSNVIIKFFHENVCKYWDFSIKIVITINLYVR